MKKARDYFPAIHTFGAKWLRQDLVAGVNSSAGNVYYVMHSDHAAYGTFFADNYTTYTDGTVSIYNTIKEAVDAATDRRGDVVVVFPASSTQGKWKENVVVDCPGIKVYGVTSGWETRLRPSDATTKYPHTPLAGTATQGYGFLIVARDIEIGGFLVDGGGGYGGVYIGDGYNVAGLNALGFTSANTASAYVHDMVLRGGSEGQYGFVLDGASANVLVEDNIIERQTVAGIYLQPGGARTTQNPIIRRNEFWAANAGYGIDLYAASTTIGTLIKNNSFRDGSSLTFTYAIRCPAGATGVTSIIGNNFACTNKVSALATDFASGNFTSCAGNAMVYVDED